MNKSLVCSAIDEFMFMICTEVTSGLRSGAKFMFFFFNDMPPASSLRLKFKRGLMVLKMLSLLALVLDLGGGLSPRRRTLTRLMLFLLILVIVVHLSRLRYIVVIW